jgi:uracil-DNA glycosylase
MGPDESPTPRRVTLAVIREDLGDCRRCKLAATRKSIVFGVGSEAAPLMFIGGLLAPTRTVSASRSSAAPASSSTG